MEIPSLKPLLFMPGSTQARARKLTRVQLSSREHYDSSDAAGTHRPTLKTITALRPYASCLHGDATLSFDVFFNSAIESFGHALTVFADLQAALVGRVSRQRKFPQDRRN